jgi:hypothetical protein
LFSLRTVEIEVAEPASSGGITQGKTLVILFRKNSRWASLSALTDRRGGIVGSSPVCEAREQSLCG